jgi:hypothetical protein
MDAFDEERWCEDRRREVRAYLGRQPNTFGPLGEWPAWHIAPYVSIWAIESVKQPGAVGWWAICGDLPTDYCSSGRPVHPRQAAQQFRDSWLAALSTYQPGDATLGDTGLDASLAPLLQARADLLGEWIEDDGLWPPP